MTHRLKGVDLYSTSSSNNRESYICEHVLDDARKPRSTNRLTLQTAFHSNLTRQVYSSLAFYWPLADSPISLIVNFKCDCVNRQRESLTLIKNKS